MGAEIKYRIAGVKIGLKGFVQEFRTDHPFKVINIDRVRSHDEVHIQAT
jgi:hypothetical protein